MSPSPKRSPSDLLGPPAPLSWRDLEAVVGRESMFEAYLDSTTAIEQAVNEAPRGGWRRRIKEALSSSPSSSTSSSLTDPELTTDRAHSPAELRNLRPVPADAAGVVRDVDWTTTGSQRGKPLLVRGSSPCWCWQTEPMTPPFEESSSRA